MRIMRVDGGAARDITGFGSHGVRLASAAVADGAGADGVHVGVFHLAAGGELGLHPAGPEQVLVVLAGRGEVSGGDGAWRPVGAGQAVLWAAGESHATRAGEPMTAVVVEAGGLREHPWAPLVS